MMASLPIGRFRFALVALLVTSVMWGLSVRPAAADSPLKDLPAVKQKLLLHESRHLLSPTVGMTLNDPYVRNGFIGFGWRYYLQSWLGVGADVAGGVGAQTDLARQINSELSGNGKSFQLSTTGLRAIAHATAEVIPLEGKVMFVGSHLLRLSVHLLGGVGLAAVAGNELRIEDSVSVMPVFGAGVRLFPSPWIAVGVDLRDYLVKRALSSDQGGAVPPAEFGHNLAVTFTVSFLVPDVPGVRP